MTGVVTFTVVAIAGCAFLIYFMFALWRDSRNSRLGQRVEIRKLPSRREKGKLLHLYSAERPRQREKKRL
jgi:threonine/homoserine/homoserine lactone efflux protein